MTGSEPPAQVSPTRARHPGVTDVWSGCDLPLLEYVAEYDVDQGPVPDYRELARLTGSDETQVFRSVERLLGGGYLQATMIIGSGTDYADLSPTADGRRVVGQWPKPGRA